MEHERCYIYKPAESAERAAKRQRVSRGDPKRNLDKRLQAFRETWAEQEKRIKATLEEADEATQDRIINFLSDTPEHDRQTVPGGLIVLGPSIASHGPFFDRLGKRITADTDSCYVVLTSAESPNLKTLLKNLIRKVTSRSGDDDDDEEIDLSISSRHGRHGPGLLNFDLGHIQEWQTRNRVNNIVVSIQDSEAFDSRVLAEVIDLFHSWLDRLPFVLLFGIATSAESFEDRLSGKSLRYLEGQKFDVTQSDEITEKLFRATVASTDLSLRIGSHIASRIMDRQKDHVQSTQDLSDSLKYAYMSHFYANYPTVLLRKDISFKTLDADVFEAVRNLPSFRRLVETILEEGRSQEARKLLESNQYLFDTIVQYLKSGRQELNTLSCAAQLLVQIRQALQISPSIRLSTIWIRAASAELIGSPLLRETMLMLKKVSSEKFLNLLKLLVDFGDSSIFPRALQYQMDLEKIVESKADSTPLRSQHDVRNESLRTTVVAQKVLLSKHKAAMSEEDKAYSELVTRFHDELEQYFSEAFIDPKSLFLSELLMYDFLSPHTEVFQPRPRFAIERALASPHDYLGCECCGPDGVQDGEAGLGSTQPATAILYQLYLESGSLINASDLWSAFNAMVGEEDEEDQSKTMALFQRALAELKHLGFVKSSRKKTDHVAKMMWKGL
ncbi:hypothetical protein M011DRAFT_416928, partial [Sporormia fimetaria CBS 119925]